MKSDVILLGHGSGGKLSHELLDELIVPALSDLGRRDQNDAAVLAAQQGLLAFTTDSYVVDPIFFPAGILVTWQSTVRSTTWLWSEPDQSQSASA